MNTTTLPITRLALTDHIGTVISTFRVGRKTVTVVGTEYGDDTLIVDDTHYDLARFSEPGGDTYADVPTRWIAEAILDWMTANA